MFVAPLFGFTCDNYALLWASVIYYGLRLVPLGMIIYQKIGDHTRGDMEKKQRLSDLLSAGSGTLLIFVIMISEIIANQSNGLARIIWETFFMISLAILSYVWILSFR